MFVDDIRALEYGQAPIVITLRCRTRHQGVIVYTLLAYPLVPRKVDPGMNVCTP
jgi:hypothetical protein